MGKWAQSGMALTAAVLATVGLSAPASAADTPRKGGTVIFTLGGDPPWVNPILSTGIPEGVTGCIIYEGLTQATTAGGIEPKLAKSWSVSPDGKTYSFDLVKANWHDGKPFTSADVKFSLIEGSSKYAAAFAPAGRAIESIETPAPDKVIIKLKYPFGPLLATLGCSLRGAILPAHIYQGTEIPKNPANTTNPVGTGPFKLAEWKRGDHLRYVRNNDYWDPKKPYLDGVIGKIIPQPAARVQALIAGEVDYVSDYYLAPNDYAQVKASAKHELMEAIQPPTIDLMFLNNNRKPLDDKRVRQALLMATDREYLVKTGYLAGEVGTMPFTNRLPWAADPNIDYRKMYPLDPARANALLDEAGLKRGAAGIRFKVTMVFSADEPEPPLVSAALKVMWRAVGVDLVNEALDRTSAGKRMFDTRDFDTTMTSYVSFGDPALGIARIFVTSSIGKVFGNPTGYSNPAVDAIFEKGEQATDLAERGGHYRQAQAILAQDLPVLTLHERVLYDGIAKSIRGIEEENYLLSWRDAWLAN